MALFPSYCVANLMTAPEVSCEYIISNDMYSTNYNDCHAIISSNQQLNSASQPSSSISTILDHWLYRIWTWVRPTLASQGILGFIADNLYD